MVWSDSPETLLTTTCKLQGTLQASVFCYCSVVVKKRSEKTFGSMSQVRGFGGPLCSPSLQQRSVPTWRQQHLPHPDEMILGRRFCHATAHMHMQIVMFVISTPKIRHP